MIFLIKARLILQPVRLLLLRADCLLSLDHLQAFASSARASFFGHGHLQ
jgi:hypothetical protein